MLKGDSVSPVLFPANFLQTPYRRNSAAENSAREIRKDLIQMLSLTAADAIKHGKMIRDQIRISRQPLPFLFCAGCRRPHTIPISRPSKKK